MKLKDHLSSSRFSRNFQNNKPLYKDYDQSVDNPKSFYDKSYSPEERSQTYLPDAPNGRNYDSNVLKITKLKSNQFVYKKRLHTRNVDYLTEDV